MRKMLTPKAIEHLDPAEGKRYEVRDTLVIGLLLRVSRTGNKVWYVTTRVQGKVKRIKIGTYPILSLADARESARTVLRDIQLGRFQGDDAAISTPSLGEVIPQFIELHAKVRNRDWRETERIFVKFEPLNETPIDQIKHADVVRILDGMVAKGTPFRANRALAAIKKLCSWCVDRGILEIHPLTSLKPPAKERSRDRVLSRNELIACWQAADVEGCPFGKAIKLLILTGQRRGEIAGMRWSEIDFERALWILPAERTKNATQHMVPLTDLAVEVLNSVPRFLGSDFVFTTTGCTPISGFSRLKRRLDHESGASDWRFHDRS